MEIKIDNKRTKEYAKELVAINSSKSDIYCLYYLGNMGYYS